MLGIPNKIFCTYYGQGSKIVLRSRTALYCDRYGRMTCPYCLMEATCIYDDIGRIYFGEPILKEEKDPSGLSPNQPGAKLDYGKIRPYLVYRGFVRALKQVWHNGTFGANKYTDDGWKDVANGKERYMEAFHRHYDDYLMGIDYDKDSGTHNKAAMVWNLLASLELELREKEMQSTNYDNI